MLHASHEFFIIYHEKIKVPQTLRGMNQTIQFLFSSLAQLCKYTHTDRKTQAAKNKWVKMLLFAKLD